jgi:hypothetical protein
MNLKSLLSIYASVSMMFCMGLLLLPSFWITLYGAEADAQAALLLRLVGALFGGIAVMAWRARTNAASRSLDGLVLGLAVLNGLAAGVALFGALSGVYNQFAWGPVATFALFAVAFTLIRRSEMLAS